MQINIESPLISAAEEDGGYQPVFRGQPLEPEASLPEVSLRNLRVLRKAGLEVACMLVVEHGHVLIVFTGGETYLATGFAVGQFSDLTKYFAQFATEALGRDAPAWENHLGGFYGEDHRGLIELDLRQADSSDFKPRVFGSDATEI